MNPFDQTKLNPRQRNAIPYAVLAVGVVLTAIATTYVYQTLVRADRVRFHSTIRETDAKIRTRLAIYAAMLRASNSFCIASYPPTGDNFRSFAKGLHLQEQYPGAMGLGFVVRYTAKEYDTLIFYMRTHGVPDFHTWPDNPLPEKSAIVFLEPPDNHNNLAIGYDMSSDPVRRMAMERARDSGQPAATGKVRLVQDIGPNPQAGFLIYFPVYRTATIPATVAERRASILGWVYSPFRSDDLLLGIFESGADDRHPIDFQIFDGAQAKAENLMHRSAMFCAPLPEHYTARYTAESTIDIAGHPWLIQFSSRPEFHTSFNRALPPAIAVLGMLTTLILFMVTRREILERAHAEQIAMDLQRSQQDLTRAKDAADSARAQAETANRLKDEFLATLSHELRTPLNAILGWAQLLTSPKKSGDDLRHGLETIDRNARAQAQLIEDLLDISRIISGKMRLDVRSVDLTTVLRAALTSVRLAADAKRIRLVENISPDPTPPVRGDGDRLQQVLWNLLSNAIKFTPAGGAVEASLKVVDTHIEITITDTGQGIDVEFLPYVFERFRQADASTTRKHGGLGLGLAIVRNLVEQHGGTVHATSPGSGKGSSFTIRLPAEADAGAQLPAPQNQPPDVRSTSAAFPHSLKGLRIMVVDDEPDTLELLRRMLEDSGASVTAVDSANRALEILKSNNTDLFIGDIGMPDTDGYELIQQIRAFPAPLCNIPAIAVTAFARAEDRSRALAAGYQLHLPKPLTEPDLLSAVASLVRPRI